MLKQLLQGKPFGHPLHPILVHLPIGLFLLSFVFDVAGMIFGGGMDAFLRPAFYTMVLGILGALLAAVPGLVDYSDIRRDHPARPIATRHMLLNFAAVAIYIGNAAVRCSHWNQPRLGVLPFVLSLLGVAILSYSGYLGGVMVYDDGIAVGRHRRRGKTPTETIVPTDPQRDGFVTVIDETQLDDRQTLRAQVNGVVMTIAKVDGQVYAFQDFCTHRFGPLSEGCFEANGQIKCPWHGSCFDMRSGKVTQGPAKEDIRAFDVIVRDGKVMVRASAN